MANPTPNDVLVAAVAFRGRLDDMNDDVVAAIVAQAATVEERDLHIRVWGGLKNAADREVDRAAMLVFAASDSKLKNAAAAISSASDDLDAGKQRLNDITKALTTLSEAVGLFSSAVKFLA